MPRNISGGTARSDALSRKVALTAHINRSGLTVGGKSRALAAIDRLIGGFVGWPAEFFEGKRAQAQAKGEAREAMIRADSEAALRLLNATSGFGQATLARFLREEYRKQDNRISVVAYATEHLLTPSQSAGEENRLAPSAEKIDPPELDDDWINVFGSYAENASSEHLRDLWARVLAGQIRKPKSFSPTTLRMIAEMDAEIAREFQEVYRFSLEGYSLRPEPFEGATMERFALLADAGLIQTDATLTMTIHARADGFGYLIGDEALLRVTFMREATSIWFPVIRITHVGKQIGAILPRDEKEALLQIGRTLIRAKKVEFCVITGRVGTLVQFDETEIVHENA